MNWFEPKKYRTGALKKGFTIDTFSFLFSYYAVPVAIGILSLIVLLHPVGPAETEHGTPISMRVLVDPDSLLSAADAAAALQLKPLVDHPLERSTYLVRD
jgi:hypothetical protein